MSVLGRSSAYMTMSVFLWCHTVEVIRTILFIVCLMVSTFIRLLEWILSTRTEVGNMCNL